jgi:hypothetical protein
MRFPVLAVALALAGTPLWAQRSYPRHNFTGGIGGAFPRSDLSSVMQSAPGVSIGYGYRFARYLQADTGLEVLFGAAGVREFESTQIGTFRIKDREYFVPLGGRVIVPFMEGRLLIHGGGGAAFMKYNESLNQPSSYYRVGCVTVPRARAGVTMPRWASIISCGPPSGWAL